MLNLVQEVVMIRFLMISVLLSLMACGSAAGPKFSGHKLHVMKGSIPHIGDPVLIPLSQDGIVTVKFSAFVRYLHGNPDGNFRIQKLGESLRLQAKEGFSEDGELLKLMLKDGRQYTLKLIPESDENPYYPFIGIDGGGNVVHKRVNVSVVHRPDKKIDDVMQSLQTAAQAESADIPGLTLMSGSKGKTLFNTNRLRGTIENMYSGPGLIGYTVKVENLTHSKIRLSAHSIPLKDIRKISFQSKELYSRPSRMTQEPLKGPYITRAYIVARVK
jgi:hypothetical protein